MRGAVITACVLVLVVALSPVAQDRRTVADVLFSPTGSARLLERRISQELATARRRVVVAVYQFTSKPLAEALAQAKRRGVEVQVLVDGSQASNKLFPIETLLAAGIPVRTVWPDGRKGGGGEMFRPKFHHKYCVIDGERVITGSFNWTVLADESNHENLVIIADRGIAGQYVEQFDRIWKDTRITED